MNVNVNVVLVKTIAEKYPTTELALPENREKIAKLKGIDTIRFAADMLYSRNLIAHPTKPFYNKFSSAKKNELMQNVIDVISSLTVVK